MPRAARTVRTSVRLALVTSLFALTGAGNTAAQLPPTASAASPTLISRPDPMLMVRPIALGAAAAARNPSTVLVT